MVFIGSIWTPEHNFGAINTERQSPYMFFSLNICTVECHWVRQLACIFTNKHVNICSITAVKHVVQNILPKKIALYHNQNIKQTDN